MQELSIAARLRYPGFTLDVTHSFGGEGITALFGPSGCGKTTLLRIIAGFEREARGRVAFAGDVWMDGSTFVPPHRRGVGYVFQDARLFPHLTVRGNLAYAHRRAAPAPARYSFDDVVDALDLGALLGRRPGGLSGGERQRVAIGRTLLARPRLLLMDEPLAALDTRRKAEILPYIARLPDAFGVPVIHVTHALEEVTQLCDRIVALAQGRVVASGDVAETLERLDVSGLQGRFEAGVLLRGRVVSQDPELHLTRVDLGGATLEVPGVVLTAGAPLRLRVRARDVSLALRRPRGVSIRNMLDARILSVAPEPDTAFAEVLMDVAGQHLRARVTRAAVQELGLSADRDVVALVKSVAFDRQALPRRMDNDAG
ncbi:molybdenum ABC transporter ATP-binding protein [Roseovarius salis]|uniref:molybdenum ABC transporter ATP-binding protein n=1 Tax=Roseovarius salis TaxID=3376063 RepID=UPI0037CA5C18